MKLLFKSKDGGSESTVTGYWLIESKSLFSIVLLKFNGTSRDAFHTHAFNSISWLIKGKIRENFISDDKCRKFYYPSIKPIITKKEYFHKVDSFGISWIISFRGPWDKNWKEYLPEQDKNLTLSNGRKIQ